MNDRHGEGKIFYDVNWYKYEAPVIPPKDVIEKLKINKLPVEWRSGTHDRMMFYRTQYHGEKVVTRLLIGSSQPALGWLKP